MLYALWSYLLQLQPAVCPGNMGNVAFMWNERCAQPASDGALCIWRPVGSRVQADGTTP